MRRRLAACLVWLLAGAGTAAAQATPPAEQSAPQGQAAAIRSPVLTIDPDVLFEESLFGRRILEDVREETAALAVENRRIEAELTAQEQSLTERRPEMSVEAFRAEADAFDAKVQRIRAEQDAKERGLEEIEAEGREAFLTAAQPILGRLMLERGAAVILDRRSVFLGFGAIDITEAAVAAVDDEIGTGAEEETPE